jgi:hypothetical protein
MKQITHTIGGQELTLGLGRMWFSKFFGEATSSDPLMMSEFLGQSDKQFDFIVGLLYAGVNCYNKVNKTNNLITIEQAQDWVGEMEESDAAALINKFVEAMKVSDKGEVEAQVVNP